MSVKIRLHRFGTRKKPYYRVVAVDERKRRDGACIEQLGRYQPIAKDEQFTINEDKVIAWLKNGAQPTDTILHLLKKSGVWQKYLSAK